MNPSSTAEPIPARFRVARRTLLFDTFMNRFIAVGGIAVILAVFGILVFITVQVLPLFGKAEVRPLQTHRIEERDVHILAVDEWSELPAVVTPDGRLFFHDLQGDRGAFEASSGLPEDVAISTVRYRPIQQRLVYGTTNGRFAIVDLGYTATFPDGDERRVVPQVKTSPLFDLQIDGSVQAIDHGDSGTTKLVVALMETAAGTEVHAATLQQRRSLLGAGATTIDRRFELTSQIPGSPVRVAVPQAANAAVIANASGEVFYFELTGDGLELRQTFSPFQEAGVDIAQMDYLLGDVSLVFVGSNEANRVYSLYRDDQAGFRRFAETKRFDDLPAAATSYFPSAGNKAFLLAGKSYASLRYATTTDIRWESRLDYEPVAAVLSSKYDRILILDTEQTLHVYELDDPHPEASLRSFFGRIWYEGQPEPDYIWQSTGGSDAFEPKLSLVPLIYGSLKGTFYALLFSVPIALLAAIYTSQFLKPEFKRVIKPTMEIMASVPSVVLGFLAALWLAPLIYDRVPSVLLVIIGVPLASCLFGWIWGRLPQRVRIHISPGWEFIAFVPVLVASALVAWNLGPVIENALFVVTDPVTGTSVADFRLWWPEFTGTEFNQRNAFVLGLMMGIAIIPIVFTISEDAMSNVPDSLRSGSLALGASRWQTALRIVVPTAAAGIFSALMIGLGRAVGETMVILMASGNTPIMEGNPFSGLRSLAANIAVELPEAPHHGTLYRTLFLSALVLFIITFVVNTFAEILRQRLREKFRAAE